MSSPKTAICGGGTGGLSATITGHQVAILEKTRAFNRAGANINLTPIAVFAADPMFRISRHGEMDTMPGMPL